MTLSIQTDRTLIRASASSTRYVLARITAPRAPQQEQRSPVNVAFVLDRSGSMADARKFTLAREAVEQALRLLRPADRFSLVVYDNYVDVLAPSSHAEPGAIERTLSALRHIAPRGSTNLGEGWLRGCEQIAEFVDRERVSRCLLLSDGLANQGITDRDELARHAGELRQRGVTTSTLGVGADFDERLLRDMAHDGGGAFYFIEGAAQIPEILTSELSEALEVVLRDVALVVRPVGASWRAAIAERRGPLACDEPESLNRYRQRWHEGLGELRVDLGALVSAQQLDLVIKLQFPLGEGAAEREAVFALEAEGVLVSGSERRQAWRYASHAENDRQPRNREVDRAVAHLSAARARAEATEFNRHGDFERAGRVLDRTAHRIA
ncbi:MAG TPA: VWA domain-containing protein, partial [Gemmatimonadaceae bacterium]